MRLPPQLLDRARRARVGLEVGAGRDFATSLALAEAAPQATWWVSDVDARVLDAPAPLRAMRLDVTQPPPADAPRADLVLAVRLPEELQGPALRLARALGADLAVRALKDEWADMPGAVVWPDGWRFRASRT